MPSRQSDSTHLVALGTLSVVVVLYSLLVIQQILLGVLVVGAVWFVYLCYLLLGVLTRIAVAVERLADQSEEPDR